MQRFTELKVWQRSHITVDLIHSAAPPQPKDDGGGAARRELRVQSREQLRMTFVAPPDNFPK